MMGQVNNILGIMPTPDKDAILAALPVLFQPDDVVELRAFHRGGKKRTDAGYFDSAHWPDLADHAARLSVAGAAVYVTLNPVDPQLLSRYCNRIEAWAAATTTDKQAVRRRWLLIDLDPARPAHTSATDRQVEAAKCKAHEISAHLEGMGWPSPAAAESGNGCHLLYAIDLPNNDETSALVKAALGALGELFDDAVIKVDRQVFNAARICKLYGTVANKGDHTLPAPWRLSKMTAAPVRALVTAQQLRALVPQLTTAAPTRMSLSQPGAFNLEDFLARHGLDYTHDMHDGSNRFKLAACPFNPEHGKGEAAVFRQLSGALGFKCQHDSCGSKGWRDVRNLLDGQRPAENATSPAAGFLAGLAARAVDPETGEILQTTPAEPSGWPEPTPLPNALPPVQAFDADLLPVALRGWVMDIAHRMQCPPDFPAVAALVALSSLIGARAVVQPKARDDWQVVPNLWGMTIGRPGVKKSPALSEALKPLSRLQADEFELNQAAHDAWELDCKVSAMQDGANEKRAKGLVSKDPAAARALLAPVLLPEEPTARRFVVNDATVEKLGELLTQNPWGILSYRDELYGLLVSLDKQGQEGSRAFYLQSYDGNQSYTFDRIGRGTTHIPRVCLAMVGGIQPGRVQEYVRGAVAGGSADDGLLQRFGLAVWPDTGGEYVHVDQWPDTPAKQAAWAVFKRLAALQPASDLEATVWRFDDGAQALFVEWLIPFENEIRGDELHPAMVSHLSKYRKLVPALALVFAMIDTPDSGSVIHEPELLRALVWVDYLRTHANRLYAAAVTPETTGAAALLVKIKAGLVQDGFKIKDVKQKGWSGLATTDEVRKAVTMLEDYDWLLRDVNQTGVAGGRPGESFKIHPSLIGG